MSLCLEKMRCNKFTRSAKLSNNSKTARLASNPSTTAPVSSSSTSTVQAPGAVRRSPRDTQRPVEQQPVQPTLAQSLSSSTQLKTTRAMPAAKPSSNLIGPKSTQSDSKPGGGRHPHPPVGNNAKLKHQCPFDGCPWRFATPYKLRRHIKSHTKETPYLCKECGRGFSVRYNLLMHIQTIHSQPQKFKCPMRGCKEAFHSQSRLNGHLRRVHKKDWKTLHAKEVKSEEGTSAKAAVKFECPECKRECSSQAKLTAHRRCHNTEKSFKCSIEGCDKVFTTREKLNKHGETHKSNKRQFSCPHKNCNRVFIRQCHLKNHLKIHTHDHQFVCPVLDCSMKFNSEGEYNVHLNSHINYGYKCPINGCELSFPCKKRLAFHTRVVHNATPTTDSGGGVSSSLLEGIQPHLPIVSSSLPSTLTAHPSLSSLVDKELVKDVDLPGLSVEDIEVILSENEDWSGEQIDQFLRSAVDLSEIESKLFSSNGGYESDSGYSTYDVSPMTSSTSSHLHNQLTCVAPQMMTMEHNPLFSLSPTATSFSTLNHLPPPPLLHEPTVSPCASDGGFFSPSSSEFSSLTNTPNQDGTFFPTQPPCPIFAASCIQSNGFHSPPGFMNLGNSDAQVTNTIPCFSSQIPDILLTGATPTPPKHASGRRASDSQLMTLCSEPIKSNTQSRSLPNLGNLVREPEIAGDVSAVKIKSEPNSCMASCSVGAPLQVLASLCSKTPGLCKLLSSSNHTDIVRAVPSLHMDQSDAVLLQNTITKVTSEQLETLYQPQNVTGAGSPTVLARVVHSQPCNHGNAYHATTHNCQQLSKSSKVNSKVPKSSHAPMKVSGRKKSQWPRSMSKANLMAFRQHILNKLKKGADVNVAESAKQLPDTSSPVLSKCGESFSCPSSFEVQVTCEQNGHTPSSVRCHSEPAELFRVTSSQATNASANEGHKLSELFQGADCTDLLTAFQFNPDTLLSTSIEDCLLDNMELKFEENDSLDHEITQFLNDATSATPTPLQHSISTSPSHCTSTPSSVQTSPNMSPSDFNHQQQSQPSSPQQSVATIVPQSGFLIAGQATSLTHPSYNISGQVISAAIRPAHEVTFGSIPVEPYQQNLLQMDRDPLLGGGNPMLQTAGVIEPFDI